MLTERFEALSQHAELACGQVAERSQCCVQCGQQRLEPLIGFWLTHAKGGCVVGLSRCLFEVGQHKNKRSSGVGNGHVAY